MRLSELCSRSLVATGVEHRDLLQLVSWHGDGLRHDVIPHGQILDVHEVPAAFQPGPWADSQCHLSPALLGQNDRADALPRLDPATVDLDGFDLAFIALQWQLWAISREAYRH